MDYKRRIVKVTLPEVGEVYLKSMSAALKMRIVDIHADAGNDGAKNIRAMAEAVVACWVDEAGKPILASVDEALDELDLDIFNALAVEIVQRFIAASPVKNSESVQT